MNALRLTVRELGLADYEPVWQAMQRFTDERSATTGDELWVVEHTPVFTLGRNGKREHLLTPGTIPVLQVDRGGQVTYHGPGQLVVYPLLDLRRRGVGVRWLVDALEQSVVGLLRDYGIPGAADPEAPGVYVEGAKVASVGLRVRRGCSYHGISLNVSLDPAPFRGINPCGYPGLAVTTLRTLGIDESLAAVSARFLPALAGRLGYDLRFPDRASTTENLAP